MRTIRIEDAALAFDQVLDAIQDAPMRLQRDGKDVAVMLSPALYEMLLAEPPTELTPRLATLFKRSLVERAEVYRALARYKAERPKSADDQ